jgi:Mn2+/Fe2+ NRAMP family transporter
MRIFKEEQRFTQPWLIILLAMTMLIPIAVMSVTYIKNPNTFSILEFVGTLAMVILAPAFIFIFKLTTRIDEKGISYQFFPFHLKFKTIEWSKIGKAYVRKYNALNEYGGWGLKGGALWSKSKGIAINVSGDIGIQLELKNGKKVLIGTQLKEDAKSVIETYKHKIIA